MKKNEDESNKSAGGVLFHLIKGELPKQELKTIFKRDYKARNQRKKMYNLMNKLEL